MAIQTLAKNQMVMDVGVVNRYLLPRVALVIISLAALAGTYITMTTHRAGPVQAFVRWLFSLSVFYRGIGSKRPY